MHPPALSLGAQHEFMQLQVGKVWGCGARRARLPRIRHSLCDVVEVLAVPVGVALRMLLSDPQPATSGLLLGGAPQAAPARALAPEGLVHGVDERVGLHTGAMVHKDDVPKSSARGERAAAQHRRVVGAAGRQSEVSSARVLSVSSGGGGAAARKD